MLAYDLFLYSHGLLFKAMHAELWAARGFANLLAVPCCCSPHAATPAGRSTCSSRATWPSTPPAWWPSASTCVVMSIAGYGLRVAGGEWGTILQVVFFFGALLLRA
jgi:hypothetical protein